MPVVNRVAVESAIRIGLALNCEIAEWCRFARKNYFYPDMPKNFQTSQYDEPIAFEGWMDVDGRRARQTFRVEIERAHMEEDTGKSLHVGGATGRIHGADYSLVDYNRAGIPLIEIVTKPIMGTGEKAPAVARAYVAAAARPDRSASGSREARMDQGNLRCRREPVAGAAGRRRARHPHRDQERELVPLGRAGGPLRDAASRRDPRRRAARSCRRPGTGTRTPASPPPAGRSPTPTTTATSPSPTWCRWRRHGSGWRSCAARCPRTRPQRRARLQAEWGFSDLDMRDTVGAGALGLVEETIAAGASPQAARKWWLGELARRANETEHRRHRRSASRPADVAAVQALVDDGTINDKLARQVFDGLLAGEGTPDEIVAARGLAIVSDEGALGAAVDTAIAANPDVADKIRDGKVAAAGALIGAVMKEMRGQADAGRVRELILESSPRTRVVATSGQAIVATSQRMRQRDSTLGAVCRVGCRARTHTQHSSRP